MLKVIRLSLGYLLLGCGFFTSLSTLRAEEKVRMVLPDGAAMKYWPRWRGSTLR